MAGNESPKRDSRKAPPIPTILRRDDGKEATHLVGRSITGRPFQRAGVVFPTKLTVIRIDSIDPPMHPDAQPQRKMTLEEVLQRIAAENNRAIVVSFATAAEAEDQVRAGAGVASEVLASKDAQISDLQAQVDELRRMVVERGIAPPGAGSAG